MCIVNQYQRSNNNSPSCKMFTSQHTAAQLSFTRHWRSIQIHTVKKTSSIFAFCLKVVQHIFWINDTKIVHVTQVDHFV